MSDALLRPVRKAHRFDEGALKSYLAERIDGFDGPMEVRQFEGGQSNPTFQLETGGGRRVLRKQPPGQLLPSAHQVDREYRVMRALAETGVPVPKMLCLCEDPSVIGAKFYLMERVEGRHFTETLLPGLSKEERGAIYRDLARVLAELHALDPKALGLSDFGRPGNYCERQIRRWAKQYRAAQTEEIEAMERLMEWLPRHAPPQERTVIVHGDYRLGNALIHSSEPRIAAVLDWELSTLGEGLADLGYICQAYRVSACDDDGLCNADLPRLGIPSEQEFVAEYCRHAGRRRADHWLFYLIYNMFRSASIAQGVYKRGLDGNASSETALEYKDEARARSESAWALAESLG